MITPSAGKVFLSQAEMRAGVAHMHADFLEGVGLEQGLEPLARRQQTLGVALLDLVGAAAVEHRRAVRLERFDQFGWDRHAGHSYLVVDGRSRGRAGWHAV